MHFGRWRLSMLDSDKQTSVMDFTIITPVYNGEKYIRETIESVIQNMHPQYTYNYIIVNDGSTDSTDEILKSFNNTSCIEVYTVKNNGEASAINLGLQKSHGELILVVNADDPIISPLIFSKSFDLLNMNPNVVAVYPDWNVISMSGTILETRRLPDYSQNVLIGEFFCLPGPGAIFRRSTALKVGGRSSSYKYVSDYDFWLKLSQEGDFLHIPEVLAQWRSHSESTSVNSKGLDMGLERIKVIEAFVNSANISNHLKRKARAHAYYHAALLCYFSKNIPGRNWMIKAFLIQRGWIKNADIRIVVFCLFYPFSRYLLPLINRTPFINNPIKNR
jgi:glycosyltransferase involved in cell wall biosynthesis